MTEIPQPFHLENWIEEHKDQLRPPISNVQLFKGAQWENHLVMVIGGPNSRPDYHDDPGEELFLQLKGDIVLKLINPENKERSDVVIKEGEIFLLPAHWRHSPQRPAGSIGLVIERYRKPDEIDALEWYDDDGNLEFRGEFSVQNIEKDLVTVQEAWADWKRQDDRTIPTTWRIGEEFNW